MHAFRSWIRLLPTQLPLLVLLLSPASRAHAETPRCDAGPALQRLEPFLKPGSPDECGWIRGDICQLQPADEAASDSHASSAVSSCELAYRQAREAARRFRDEATASCARVNAKSDECQRRIQGQSTSESCLAELSALAAQEQRNRSASLSRANETAASAIATLEQARHYYEEDRAKAARGQPTTCGTDRDGNPNDQYWRGISATRPGDAPAPAQAGIAKDEYYREVDQALSFARAFRSTTQQEIAAQAGSARTLDTRAARGDSQSRRLSSLAPSSTITGPTSPEKKDEPNGISLPAIAGGGGRDGSGSSASPAGSLPSLAPGAVPFSAGAPRTAGSATPNTTRPPQQALALVPAEEPSPASEEPGTKAPNPASLRRAASSGTGGSRLASRESGGAASHEGRASRSGAVAPGGDAFRSTDDPACEGAACATAHAADAKTKADGASTAAPLGQLGVGGLPSFDLSLEEAGMPGVPVPFSGLPSPDELAKAPTALSGEASSASLAPADTETSLFQRLRFAFARAQRRGHVQGLRPKL